MADTIQKTMCHICGELVYATFQTTFRAVQQAHQALAHHMKQKHQPEGS